MALLYLSQSLCILSKLWEQGKKNQYKHFVKDNINFPRTVCSIMLLWKYHTHRFVPAVTWIRLKGRITSNILDFNSTFDLTKTTHDKWEAQTGFQLVDKHEHWTSLCQLTQTVFSATWGSPLGVIVDEYVIFHSQFEVWDLLAHPPWASRHTIIMRSYTWHSTSLSVGMWELTQRDKRWLTEWSRWFHEQHHDVYPVNIVGQNI